ncbi:hypothetical protein HDU93_001671 [Gonapodya sp. JEL0774]|nr:hypothetical protein HDU93_001671 [Gonapodya sp. JEL0774]
MQNPQDIHLIEAVEAGDAARVRQLLSRQGLHAANAHVRKRVKLQAQVNTGDHVTKQTETIECESVLSLAIMYGFAEVVVALLEHGADPNARIEWKLANKFHAWGAEDWSRRRWWYTHSFPNALSLALACGGTYCGWDGRTGVIPQKEDGSMGVNKLGGLVRIDGSKRRDTFVKVTMRPHMDIVIHLLRHETVVTESLLNHAKELKDTRPALRLLLLLESQHHHLSRIAVHMDELSLRAAVYESKVTVLENQLAEITLQHSSLKSNHEKLQLENKANLAKIAALEAELAILRGQSSSSVDAECLKEQPAPVFPKTIKAVTLAASDFTARADDEIDLKVGDEVFVELQFGDGWGLVSSNFCLLHGMKILAFIP